jgi:peptidoglycan biosynthesis protein MviN/MurJ (putative lipid II flippase)
MILNLVLVFPLAHAGLALATSLAAFFNASLLLFALLKTKIYRPSRGWRSRHCSSLNFALVISLLFKYLDKQHIAVGRRFSPHSILYQRAKAPPYYRTAFYWQVRTL